MNNQGRDVSTRIAEAAPAKVNLFLHVVGRRPDGYHLLDSVAAFAEAADEVAIQAEASDTGTLTLAIDGSFASALPAEPSNLVLRAASALREASGASRGAALLLRKELPVASGIGGGSADAAAALRLLVRAWGLGSHSSLDLTALALSLGADVPICLRGRACRMGGIGEVLRPVPTLPDAGLVLVNPGVPVATALVFKARTQPFSHPATLSAAWPTLDHLIADLMHTRNDLAPPAIVLCPAIAEVLAALRGLAGCRLARMSGSGATCFGLFTTADAAREAAAALRRPGWWTHGGRLVG